MYYNKITNQQNWAKMQKNAILLNNHQFFPIISSFLTQTDRLNFHSINRTVRELTSSFSFWPSIELSNMNQSASASSDSQLSKKMQWAFKALRQFKPRTFTIFMHDVEQQILQKLVNLMMQGPIDSVTSLDIYCQSCDVHLACSLSFPNLEQLTLRSKCASNQLAQFMTENLNKLDSLIVIKNDVEFTCKKLSKYIKKPMKKLVMKPYIIDFQQIEKVAEQSANTLVEIQIDVEECSQKSFANILKPLRRLEKLRLYHLQNFDSDKQLVCSLSTSVAKISQLSLTKAYSMPLSKIIQTTSTKFLQSLDITDSKFVNDQDMKRIAQFCCNLREINVSWCNCVTSQGLKMLFNGCLKLEKVDITGVKQSRDLIFGEYNNLLKTFDSQKFSSIRNSAIDDLSLVEDSKIYDQNFFFSAIVNLNDIKILRRLKHLDCQSCNGISDEILKVIYVVNRRARVYNYYGNYMGLFIKEDESTFC